MFTRSIGKVLRGKATPLQLSLACILGAMIGFVPSAATSPGLLITLTLLLIVLNANLFIAAIVGAGAKLFSLLLLPVSFMAGRALIDGPTAPLFEFLINAPVLALFGFDYYATTGGVLLGLIVGVVAAIVLSRAIRTFRAKMANLEEGSERFKAWSNKGWVKALTWIVLGKGHGKATYRELAEKKIGNPVRPLGVVLAVLVVGLLVIVQMFASGPVVAFALQRGLQRANGATVDINNADVNLREGRITLTGLAMADPNALDTDLLRAASAEIDVSAADLLRKRIALDRVVLNDASSGKKRQFPGRLVGPPPEPAGDDGATLPSEKELEEYLKTAKEWKERLAQIREWLDKAANREPGGEAGEKETLRERLEREAAQKGYARVRASHRVEGAPSVAVYEVLAEGVTTEHLPGETLDVRAENLSTQPWLLDGAPHVSVQSRSGNLGADVLLGDVARTAAASKLEFLYKGLPADAIGSQLAFAGQPPFRGGTIDVQASGGWAAQGVGYIDMPLNVTLNDTELTIAGGAPQPIDILEIPLGVRGPLDNPRITLSEDLLADALVKAGAGALADKVKGEAEEKIKEELGDKLGDEAKGLLDSVLGGGKKKDNGGGI